jgi:hypothetical protein
VPDVIKTEGSSPGPGKAAYQWGRGRRPEPVASLRDSSPPTLPLPSRPADHPLANSTIKLEQLEQRWCDVISFVVARPHVLASAREVGVGIGWCGRGAAARVSGADGGAGGIEGRVWMEALGGWEPRLGVSGKEDKSDAGRHAAIQSIPIKGRVFKKQKYQ